jgi:anti-sigma regulatory factor (Ser/Thr protein kinase)
MPSARSPARPERELRVAAKPSELARLREHVGDFASALGLDGLGRREFVLAANEAVTNAIRHGTPDADGMIEVRISVDGDFLTLTVSDCGPFVTYVADRDPLAESGRGFALMTKLVDEVQLSVGRRHTTLRLSKRLP